MKLTGIFDNRATMTRERWLHGERVWSLPAGEVESGIAFKFGTRPGFGSYRDLPARLHYPPRETLNQGHYDTNRT